MGWQKNIQGKATHKKKERKKIQSEGTSEEKTFPCISIEQHTPTYFFEILKKMVKQISVVFEVSDSDELEFFKKIYEFAEKYRADKKSNNFPKIVGLHTKLLDERDKFK